MYAKVVKATREVMSYVLEEGVDVDSEAEQVEYLKRYNTSFEAIVAADCYIDAYDDAEVLLHMDWKPTEVVIVRFRMDGASFPKVQGYQDNEGNVFVDDRLFH